MKKSVQMLKLISGVALCIFGGMGTLACIFVLPSGLLLYIPILILGIFLIRSAKKKLALLKSENENEIKPTLMSIKKETITDKPELPKESINILPNAEIKDKSDKTDTALDYEPISIPTTNIIYRKENSDSNISESLNTVEETIQQIKFPSQFDDEYLYKVYNDVYIAYFQNIEKVTPCEQIEFIQEPDNEYDNNAIKIMCNGLHIGYISKGNIQNVVNDFIRRQETVIGKIEKVSPRPTCSVALYRKINSLKSFTGTLINTSADDGIGNHRYENMIGLEVGDTLIIEYDVLDDKYVVTDSYGSELGELNKKCSQKVADLGEGNIYLRVKEIVETDDNKYNCSVIFYYLER